MFGSSQFGVVGASQFALDLPTAAPDTTVFFLFQVVFAGTTVTIISGAIAERTTFYGYLGIVVVMAVVYPVFGHWVWAEGGWLYELGFVDFAGSTVVHGIGGWAALAAAIVIGPRRGRFSDGEANPIRPSNLPLAMTGAVLLWFGWIGFNGGSTLAFNEAVPGVVAVTMLGGASGLVVSLVQGWRTHGYPVPTALLNGALAGLVAVTAGAHALPAWAAVVVGGVGDLVALRVEDILERAGIDDAVGAVPVHLGAGMWGTLAVGLFGRSDALGTDLGRFGQIGVQMVGVGAGAIWGFGMCWILFRWTDSLVSMRVSPEHEDEGLNVAEHREPTALIELLHHLDHQVRTGAIAEPIAAESFTEVGQIADQFNGLTSELRSMASVAEQIASGALTVDVMPKSDQDTFGLAFRTMVRDLRATVRGISGSASELRSSADALSRLTDDVETGVEVQREGIRTSEVAFDDLRALIDQLVVDVDELATQTSTALGELVTTMVEGHHSDVERSNPSSLKAAVAAIESSAEEISSIVDVVRSIADTTTLLALNAHIEAARAGGSAGRAFTVVASEVQALSSETVAALAKIESQVAQLQRHSSAATGIVGGVIDDVQSLGDTFGNLRSGVGDAAGSLLHQADQARRAISTIDEVSERNATVASDFRVLAGEIEGGIDQVGQQLERFTT